jgi:hypothetical protein
MSLYEPKHLKCRLGIHDWEFLYHGDRLGKEYGWGVHECSRCGKRDERYTFAPHLG